MRLLLKQITVYLICTRTARKTTESGRGKGRFFTTDFKVRIILCTLDFGVLVLNCEVINTLLFEANKSGTYPWQPWESNKNISNSKT
jgi:hypothetical protein